MASTLIASAAPALAAAPVLTISSAPALAAASTRVASTRAPLAAPAVLTSAPGLAAASTLSAASARSRSVTASAATLTAAVSAASSTLSAAASCTSAAKATYRHTFNGAAGTVTITAVRPLCAGQEQAFSLISYTAGPASSARGQFVYDTAGGTVNATHRSVSLQVTVPACYTQVDAVFGTALKSETTSSAAPYGPATLGATGNRSSGTVARYAGGNTACTDAPGATFTNACDGTFTATLANDNSANVMAVFLTGSRRIRVSPGRSTTVKATKGASLTIRDSSFTTYVATWRAPATACPAATEAPAAAPTAIRTRRVAAIATASPSTNPTTAGSTASPIEPDVAANPPRFPATKPTALAETRRGFGSILAIAAGLLMIGGGVTALTYTVRNSRRPA